MFSEIGGGGGGGGGGCAIKKKSPITTQVLGAIQIADKIYEQCT